MNIKSTSILAGLLAIASLSAFAGAEEKMNADFRCEQRGGGVAFRVSRGDSSPARVWQTDPGEDEGLELDVTYFSANRNPGAYDFEATLMQVIKVRGKVRNLKLTYEAFDDEKQEWTPILENIPCIGQ